MNRVSKIFSLLLLIFLTGCTSLYQKGNYPEKLSSNFTLSQAIKPGTEITPEIYKNLKYAAERMEDYLDELDDKITVISWYRSPTHNTSSGGAENSAHLYGLAVDFRANSTKDQRLIFNKLVKSGLSYDTIIFYKNSNFVHVGFSRDKDIKKELQLIMTEQY